ncbi:MAG TPA: hypothetical protein VGE34_04400 [Candidatus Saccharimonadales bacterium]
MIESHFNRSKGLLTPRKDIAEKSPGITRSELTTSQRLRRVEAVYLSSEQGFADQIEAANEVGHMVRQTLLFGNTTLHEPLWRKDESTDSVQTNCYGHTIVASELLDAVEIPHTISFANGHMFITMFDPKSRDAHMVDSPSKELFLDIDDLVQGDHPLEQLDDKKVATNILDASGIIRQIHRQDRDEVIARHQWLSTDDMLRPARRGAPPRLNNSKLVMRTYSAAAGREVAWHYGLMRQGIIQRDLNLATREAKEMFAMYPEVDTRAKLGGLVALRHKLGQLGLVEEMQDIAAVVDSSLPEDDKTTNRYFWFDTIRHIGSMYEDPELLADAEEGYGQFVGVIGSARQKVTRAHNMGERLKAS